jgi:hypothetical protein|tara:strand:+ start:2214 stop:2447 length:234 start_codon:yes stop_codon:yes gene_type:complete
MSIESRVSHTHLFAILNQTSSRAKLANQPAVVREQALDKGELLASNLALATQAVLVARGHVRVQVLLAGAPVENLCF